MSKKLIYILLVIAVTAVAFYPSLLNEFVDLDDPYYVFNNDLIKSFSWTNTAKIFTSGFVGTYCPLPVLTYAVEYHFFKLNPFAYHLTNYLLHLLATLLVFYLVYLLSRSLKAAFVAGLLFGIHPMHVESIAWISERKDLACAIFYLACLIAYMKYLQRDCPPSSFCHEYAKCRGLRPRPSRGLAKVGTVPILLAMTFVFALLALFSKPMAATIPFMLVLIDYFCGRKMNRTLAIEKVPFLIASGIFGAAGFYFQSSIGAVDLKATLIVKTYFLFKAIPFYLYKLLAPVKLCAMYLYHDVSPRHIAEIKYYAAILVILTALVILSKKYTKKVIFGSLFFVIALLPVLKIIPLGDSFAQDRYMYLSSIGVFYIIAAFFDRIFSWRSMKAVKFTAALMLISAVASLSVLSWQRCGVWKDTESLYLDILSKYPNRPQLYNDLGAFFAYKGDYDKAIKCFNVALMFNPDYKGARRNLNIAKIGLLNKLELIKHE